MSQILKQKNFARSAKILKEDAAPESIRWGSGNEPATIYFSDGGSAIGSCIRCVDPPCIQYTDYELEHEFFKQFPADKNNLVCPTLAITWFQEDDAPQVDSEQCVGCGLCISRCPVRAIHFEGATAQVNDDPNEYFLLDANDVNHEIVESISSKFSDVPEYGRYVTESDESFSNIYQKLQSIPFDHNHLARNLLMAAGMGAAMRRKGDTNIRMDLIFEPSGFDLGVGEVEFGNDTLSAVRNILDDIAILVGRYNLSKDTTIPVVVVAELPNKRVEFWLLVSDIRKVLNVYINTLTIGALYLLLWNRIVLQVDDKQVFYLDEETNSLRPSLEVLLERDLNISQGHLGILESSK